MLEELLAAGKVEAEYDAWLINIGEGEQFSSGFVDVNPNSKIPALVDTTTSPETKLFESGSILHYLAEKFDAFIPKAPAQRVACYNWLFWQVGSGPFVGGGFGHFIVMRLTQWNTRLIALPWKRNVNLMCWINI